MRMTMLAILAILGTTMLTGSANAAVPRNTATVNPAYQLAEHRCPPGYYWKRGRYDRWSRYHPPYCSRLVK
jgi:hypothetical protein